MATPLPMFTQGQQQQPLVGIETPHDNDVLCGRGVTTNRHVGNENFRSLVNCNKELYVTSTKRQKMTISRSIVEAVRTLEPPGRFLEKDSATGRWYDIGDKKAVEKTSQALRDGAACLRKQLSEDLSDPDFLRAVFDMDEAAFADVSKKPTTKPKAREKKGKGKQPPAKGHRRTKSNPLESATAKAKAAAVSVKKQRPVELPVSPRATQKSRHSLHLPQIPRPPQSPISTPSSPLFGRDGRASSLTLSADRPTSFGGHMAPSPPQDSPRFFRHGRFTFDGPAAGISSSRSFEIPSSPISASQSNREIPPPPPSQMPVSPPSRHQHARPPPPRPYPSPSYSRGGPQPMSPTSPPSGHRMSTPMSPPPSGPLPPGIHRLSPAGYQQETLSPPSVHRSSRQSSHGSHQSLTPHPFQRPSERNEYHRRTPEYRHSPRHAYRYRGGSPCGSGSGLTVPKLGGESPRGYDRHGHLPISPVSMNPHHRSHLRHRPQAPAPRPRPEFMPPPSSASPRRNHPERVVSASPQAVRKSPRKYREDNFYPRIPPSQEMRNDDLEEFGNETTLFVTPSRIVQTTSGENHNSGSPSGVADSVEVVLSMEDDEARKSKSPIIQRKSSKEEDRDLDLNPASDIDDEDMLVSPLPFEGSAFLDDHDADGALLDLPENIMSLPISPCGPNDIS